MAGVFSLFTQSNCSICRAAEHSLQHTSCVGSTANTSTKLLQCAKLMAYLHKTGGDMQMHPAPQAAPHHTHQSTITTFNIWLSRTTIIIIVLGVHEFFHLVSGVVCLNSSSSVQRTIVRWGERPWWWQLLTVVHIASRLKAVKNRETQQSINILQCLWGVMVCCWVQKRGMDWNNNDESFFFGANHSLHVFIISGFWFWSWHRGCVQPGSDRPRKQKGLH